jgi:hypothetical protein
MQVEQWARKPFDVDAVRVTDQNIEEVAKWCMGEIRHTERPHRTPYVYVRVHHPRNARDTKAFVGDWVVYHAENGYKVYPNRSFEWSFEKKVPGDEE